MDVPLANKDVPLLFSLHFGVDASIGIMPFFSTESISLHLLLISGNPEALTFSLPLSIGCENAYSGTVAGREFPKLWKKQTNQTFEVKSFKEIHGRNLNIISTNLKRRSCTGCFNRIFTHGENTIKCLQIFVDITFLTINQSITNYN